MSNDPKPTSILLEAGTNEVEFLLISIGRQCYSINVSKICSIQVFDEEKVAPVPHQEPEILGMIQFRDQTITVIDLRINLASKDPLVAGTKRLMVVSEFNGRLTGFVVDAVDRIQRFSWTSFEPLTESNGGQAISSVLGSIRDPRGLILVLDLESILAQLDPSMSMENYTEGIAEAGDHRATTRIVHCDDSGLIQKLVHKVLSDGGFTHIKQFNNGLDTLEYLKGQGKGTVDVILSDIEMPKMDGLTMCRILRTELHMTEVPVLFFSSLINGQMALKCKSVGGTQAFSKPQINSLVASIDLIMRGKAG